MTLREDFLAFVGKRSIAEVCRFYDLPYFLIQRWVNERSPLPPWLEAELRDRLHLTDTTPRKTCQRPAFIAAEDQTRSYAEPARSA